MNSPSQITTVHKISLKSNEVENLLKFVQSRCRRNHKHIFCINCTLYHRENRKGNESIQIHHVPNATVENASVREGELIRK